MFHWYLLFNASYVAWALLEAWISLRDRRKSRGASGDRGSLIFLIATLVVCLVGAWYAAFVLRFARIEPFHFQLFLAGLVLIWVGMALRLWRSWCWGASSAPRSSFRTNTGWSAAGLTGYCAILPIPGRW